MNHSKLALLLCLGAAAVSFGACKGDDDGGDDGNLPGAISMAGANSLQPAPQPAFPGALGPSNPPDLGDTIDRAGRVAIAAALIERFNADDAVRAQQVEAYNRSGLRNPAFEATMKTSLAILDGLDGTCGNQLLAGDGADRYAALTGALLDDQIYVNSDSGGSAYLGVEAEALGAVGPGEGLGGGRQPGDDSVEVSYSVLAAGALGGIDDGVDSDDATHDPDTFPFLADPN